VILCIFGSAPKTRAAATQPSVSFGNNVAPILAKNCVACHGPDKSKGKYRLDTFQRLMKPGSSGEAPITPGKPSASELYRLVSSHDEDERMPQKADPLPQPQVNLIRLWIEQGAKFDGPDPSAQLASLGADRDHPAAPAVYPRAFPITALSFSADGERIAASGYHEVAIWSAADGRLLTRIGKLAQRTQGVTWIPNSPLLAIAGGAPGALGELRVGDPAHPSSFSVLERTGDNILSVCASSDGRALAAGGADGLIRIYNVATGKRLRAIEQHADWVTDLAFSPDGTRLASASRDKSVRICDLSTGAAEMAYLAHEEQVFSVAWSDDGKTVYSAGRDHKIHAWKAADGKPVGQINDVRAEVSQIRTGGGMFFLACSDGIVLQYAQGSMQFVRRYPAMSDWVYCLAVDPARHRIAAGSYSGEVRIWNFDSGQPLGSFIAAPGWKGEKPAR
jgi:WD40 repeat protein